MGYSVLFLRVTFYFSLVLGQCLFFAHAGPLETALGNELEREMQSSSTSFEREAMASRVKAARASLYPSIKLKGIEARRRESVRSVNTSLIRTGENTFDNTRFSASISQPIFDREIHSAVSEANAYAKYSEESQLLEQASITEAFLASYMEIAKGKELSASFENAIIWLEIEQQNAKKKLDANLVTIREFNSISTLLINTKKDREFYRANAARSRSYLDSRLVGGAETVPLISSEVDFSVLLAPSVGAKFKNSSEILDLKTGIEVLKAQESKERARRLPKVSLVAQYEYDDAAETVFGGPNRIEDYEIGLQLEWQIFRGGGSKHKISEIKSLRRAKEARLASMINATQGGFEAQKAAFEQAKQRLTFESEVLGYRKETSAASRESFEVGKQSYLDYIDSQLQREESHRAVIFAKYDLMSEYVRLHSQSDTLQAEAVPQLDAFF